MADAFRGLTIRIGADARPVKSALDSINYSAGQAQKQFNKMSKALRFDPTNVKAMEASIDLASDKATLMARAFATLEVAVGQAKNESVEFKRANEGASGTVEAIADKYKDVYSQTNKLRMEQHTVNAQLQHIYDSVKNVHAGFIQGKDAAEGMHLAVLGEKEAFQVADKYVKQLQSDLSGSEDKAKAAFAEIKRLLDAMSPQSLGNLASKFGLNEANDKVKALLDKFSQLRVRSGEVNSDLKEMGKVEGFRALRNEAIAYESSLRQAVSETTRLKAEMAAIGNAEGLPKAVASIQRINSAVESATANARIMDAAYDALPKNIETARMKIEATKNAQEALTAKTTELKKAIEMIEHNGSFAKVEAGAKNISLEFERASNEATELGAKVLAAEERVKALDAQKVDFIGPRTTQEWEQLSAAITEAKQHLEEVKAKAETADDALEKAAMYKEWERLNIELKETETRMAELHAKSSVLNKITGLGAGLRELGYGLYSTVTPAILMMGRYAIQAAEDIDSAYRDMRKTVNGTEEDFEHLKEAAIDFSTTHVTSADTLLEIEAMGGQLGIAVENLESFSEVVSNLDIATDIGAEDMAKYIGQLSNIMDDIDQKNPAKYQKDITSFSDAIVRLGNNSAAQESSIMKVMMRIASIGNISGMTTPQLLAVSTAVAATGQGCEAAGTAISKTFSNIESAVGAGSVKLQAFADVAGMSAEEFASTWENEPIKAFDAFISGLRKIQDEGGSVDNTLASLGINSVRQKQALMGLTNTLDVMHDSLKMSTDAWNGMSTTMADGKVEEAGDAAREAQRKSEGFSGALGIMRNQAMALANELAEGAAPWVKRLGDLFGDLTKAVMAMPAPMKEAVVGMLGMVAAIGPLAVASGTIIRSIGEVGKAISAVSKGAMFAQLSNALGGGLGILAKLEETFPRLANGILDLGMKFGGLAAAAAPFAPMIAAAGGSIAYLVTSISDANAKIQMHNTTVERLGSVMQETAPKVGSLKDNLTVLGVEATKTAHSYDEVIAANSAIVSSIEERNRAAQSEIGSLEAAREAIALYGNANRQLTATEQGQLVAAIDLVNQKCGTQYQVLDKLTGKLGDESGAYLSNKGAIDEYIAKKMQLMQVEALEADLADLNARKRETLAALYSTDASNTAEMTKLYQEVEALNSAIDYTTKAIGSASAAADGMNLTAGQSVVLLQDWQGAFEGIFNNAEYDMPWKSYQESLADFGKAIDEAGLSVEQFSQMSLENIGTMVRVWMQSGGDMQAALDAVGMTAKSAGELLSETFAAANGNAEELAQHVGDVNAFAESLKQAGMSAQVFSQLGIEGFDNLLMAAGGDMNNIMATLEVLNNYHLDPKTLNVNEDGSFEVEGKLWHVDTVAKTITDGEHVLKLTADVQLAQDDTEQTQEMADEYNESDPTAEFHAETEEANQKADEAKGKAESYQGEYTAKALLDTSAADEALDGLIGRLEAFGRSSYSASVGATENAAGGIFRMNAVGALSPRAVRAIPRNASGAINGIVSRPTLTNIGWVGEAGAEAVLHMRNAGGAVIPLSNRHYVRPFARAVASEMGGETRNVTVNLTLDYKAGDDADKLARGVASRLEAIMNMEA